MKIDLEQLANAVLDGTAVDWAAESDLDGFERPLVQHLKVVAAVAGVHRMPDSWGHLHILERIGKGTFGEVYRAWDSRLDREVALKLLPADRSSDYRPDSSFIHEGRLLARVRHNNIVTIHGAEQIGDRIGLWMELVRGRTLEQMLGEGTSFTPAEAVRIGLDLCTAVSAVHAAGLLHRDIKAHNVMLADDGRVVLMDFGTGREVNDRSTSDVAGTPLYVAPEVLDGEPATAQIDVYSLGVLLFHILTGSYPVQGQTVSDIRAAHKAGVRATLRGFRPGVPSRMARVIERAVDPRPDDRYPSIEALGAALRNATVGTSRRRLIYSAAAATVLLAAGLAWESRARSTPPATPTIAVLPFENRSADPDGEEIADGLTTEIQRNLAVIEGLNVRSSSSSFAFKNKARNLAEIGEQLGVGFVLEGSVSQSSRRLQVTARFARISGDVTLWANTFNRDTEDLSAILDEISIAVVNELGVALGRGQRRYDLAPDAYYQFLRASAFHARRGPENTARAAELYQQVAAEHSTYAPAWAGLASALAELSRPSLGEEIIPLDPRAGPAALRAIQLDPLLADGHAAIGNMYASYRDWVNARRSFLKALTLNPSLTTIHTDFVLGVLLPIADLDESVRQLDAARIADPLSLDVRRIQALVFVDAGRYEEAIENCHWIRQYDPAFPYVDVWLGRALYFSGRFDEAREALERAGPEFWGYLGYLLAVSGRRDEAEALAARHPDSPGRAMLIYGGLGDKDRAFDALVHTVDVNWWRAATWLHRPEMAILRGDPRLAAVKKRLGLPN
jgi:serine/threonine protein kinase